MELKIQLGNMDYGMSISGLRHTGAMKLDSVRVSWLVVILFKNDEYTLHSLMKTDPQSQGLIQWALVPQTGRKRGTMKHFANRAC